MSSPLPPDAGAPDEGFETLCAHFAKDRSAYQGAPQAELTRRELRGTSGLLSLQLKDSRQENVFRFVDGLKYFGIGCSWGGFESLAIPITVRASQIDRPGDDPVWLARLHIGLEAVDDLWADIAQSLNSAAT